MRKCCKHPGGGFKHGQHLGFDQQNNYPLTNLYVSMLHRLSIEANSFSTSKGTIRELELACFCENLLAPTR